MTESSQIKLLSCKDVSDEYDASPYEQIFLVEYVKDGRVYMKTISYNYKSGFSPDPEN